MKICHIIFSLEVGGAESMLIDIINEQCKTEEVSLVIVNNIIDESVLQNLNSKVSVIEIGRTPSSKNPFKVIHLNYNLHKIKPNIIHCHNVKMIRLLFPQWRKKAVLTLHDTRISSPQLMKKYKTLYVISHAVCDDLFDRYNLDTTLVYNGINFSLIHKKVTEKERLDFRIVQIGRLYHNTQDQHLLIEAVRILVHEKHMSHITVDFIGEGPSLIYFEDLVSKYNLKNHISFKGLKNRSVVYKQLCDYDLLVQPSIYEGFGLTVAEAMAAKVPVLVSDTEGPMEIIQEGKYGTFFESGNSEDCALKINEIMNNYEQFALLAEQAYQYCADNYSIELTAQKYIDNYRKL